MVRDGASESTAIPSPGSSRERRPAVTGDQAVPEPEPARGADLDRDEVAALRAILEGTARSTGAVFFQTLVRHLASALGVSYAFVAEFAGAPTRVRTLAYWGRGRIQENLEFELAGTPCEDVVRGGLCHHPQEVRERFPGDRLLVDLGVESYLGVPLLDGEGRVLGHLAVFDERPMAAELRQLFIFRIFAARAAVELERLRVEQQLRERERQLDSLMGHLPGLAYRALADDHWTALFASKGVEDLTGYPADEFTSRRLNYADLMLPEDLPATREAVFTALRERRMYEAEHRIRHKDGSVRWIWARGHGVFAPDGSLRFIEGLNLDMTRQKQAEQELRESEERFRGTFENAAVGIVHSDSAGRFLRVNQKFCAIVGYPREELLHKTLQDIIHPDELDAHLEHYESSFARNAPPAFGVERRFLRKDGTAVWVEAYASFQHDASGRPVYVIGAVQDISERKRLEEEVRFATARLELALRGSDIGFWDIDMPDGDLRNGRIHYVNVWEQLGYERPDSPKDQETGMALVHPGDRAPHAEAARRYLAGETSEFEVESRVCHKDGSYRWMISRGVAVRDAGGEPIRFLGSGIDITDRKRAEEALRQANAR